MLTAIKTLKSNDIIRKVQPKNGSPGNTGDVHKEVNSGSDIFSKRAHETIFFVIKNSLYNSITHFF